MSCFNHLIQVKIDGFCGWIFNGVSDYNLVLCDLCRGINRKNAYKKKKGDQEEFAKGIC